MEEEMNELVALGTNDAFSRYFMGQRVPERGSPGSRLRMQWWGVGLRTTKSSLSFSSTELPRANNCLAPAPLLEILLNISGCMDVSGMKEAARNESGTGKNAPEALLYLL
ncbi:hypothetical protein KQX54_009102 [Cotesia glomerata]|uniref:Uncharacterized protein n=1 Tax=Cotesia glomerata TaxID=32391 RepID=A0AAV7IDT7_COTGL|nr:hypothetical protein KQX54_009102 [Cotesia glomerata]